MQNMKPCVSHDEGENISNGIMGCSPFCTMGATKKVRHKCNESIKVKGWGHPTWCVIQQRKKHLIPNGKME